jgi:CheY-like chemotaxis protein
MSSGDDALGGEPANAGGTSRGRTARPILVVEDQADVRDMVETFLHLDGYTVATAEHGLTALHRLDEVRPCLILLDLEMPVMDGVQFARSLREHRDRGLAGTPVVLVTAHASPQRAARLTGAVDVVPKPVDFDRLLAVIRTHCGAPHRRSPW